MNLRALIGALATAILAAACAPPPPKALVPVQLQTTKTPQQVVQLAAQQVVLAGLTITSSDAAGGSLVATLTRDGSAPWSPTLNCRFGDNTLGHDRGTVVLTVRVAAVGAAIGSAVAITSSAHVSVKAGILSSESDTDCVSGGAIEKQIADAVR